MRPTRLLIAGVVLTLFAGFASAQSRGGGSRGRDDNNGSSPGRFDVPTHFGSGKQATPTPPPRVPSGVGRAAGTAGRTGGRAVAVAVAGGAVAVGAGAAAAAGRRKSNGSNP
jgi:hypothetical protein